ncbi:MULTISPECIES: 30S ribosomal protein S8 [Aerococcus]|uniref:30S ribosomal protein S8 n=1 Tax=Aerococcus urinae (strain CCUG 59500 / ACS-120-V-Col10a) TaxID=2976812 RepID=UPI000200F54B|nr:30S ribosomal protein S8 [Aerococcus sp. Group 1]AEA01791.1 ribosomal protein S8 [Aerococcus sp. Group 1]MCY3031194.1 30S ribosomal protein S8 [Aerococcus sp. Group 1]MCY3054938.1 30S ribosomal protein S8 [Aerococcus sp. Group 1]MCY3056668.1 30S ribosomal protein S8 [Aerococcus sp. Group 1]MCY3062165.1 30S ribosomal protein S8 [Aerococcus sp. Group 1]
MVMTDPIADFLTRIRNANLVRHETVEVPASKMKEAIAKILEEQGYIKGYEVLEGDKQGIIRVFMKYGADNQRIITNLRRISKPGLRVYAKSDEIPKVLNGLGIAIVSTSEGVVTDKEARQKNIGGEILAYVW